VNRLRIEGLGRLAGYCWAFSTTLLGFAAGAQQQPTPLVEEALPLTSPARSSLSAIQDNWLQWDSAFQRGDEAAAEVAVNDLVQATAELGMTRLPEVCFAVLVRATLSAADGNTPRARWALAMAERLDPGRPEVAFAASVVARHEGRYLAMLGNQLRGYARLAAAPLLWRLTAENLLIWGLAAVILAGTLFVSLQLAAHGAPLVEDIAELLSRKWSITAAYLAALVVVILPVMFPAAWVAIPLYWAILFMPYARPSERAVIATVVAVLAGAPYLLAAQAPRVAVELSAPMEATRSVQERRLYGGLINDVNTLRGELPSSAATLHLIADLHQDLGQVEYARLLYQRLIEVEPLNVAAHNNIGAYYLRRRETSQAIEHLERAAAIDDTRIEPHRNLWVLYRDYLAFEEAERVLAKVRKFAPKGITSWFTEAPSSVVVMRDGYERGPEIRASLLAKGAPREEAEPITLLSGSRFLVIAFFLLLAGAITVLLARFGRRGARRRVEPPGRSAAWVPGLLSIHAGHGWRAFFALLIPVAILLLPRLTTLGYRLPWGYDPSSSAVWAVTAVSLLLYLGGRWLFSRGSHHA
jgi:tetratricopeptide (TPR) repeat protein